MTIPMLEIYVVSIVACLGSLLVTPLVGNYMTKKGKVGKDVHKVNLPEVPESGGIGFMFIYLSPLAK